MTDRLLLAQGGAHPALLATIRDACRDAGKLCILVNVEDTQLEEKLLAQGVPRYRLPRALTYEAKASIRASFYKGVVAANSWVLAADALSGVLRCEKVATLVIGGCEKLDAAALLFLRLFRERRRPQARVVAFSRRCCALHREPTRLDSLHLVNYAIEVEDEVDVAVVTRTASSSLAQKRQEAALRRLASACASSLRRAVPAAPRDVWSSEFAADVKAKVPPARRHAFNDRPVRDLGMIRRLAIETCAADASAALEALEGFARRNAAARDPRAWVASRDFDACVDACRERATPRRVEAPPKWALLKEALAGATSVAILVATRDQARSIASFLKVGAEAACLRLRRRLVARALPHLPSKASRDTPYQRLVRAELDDALEERNDDGDQALADALALSLEEAEDDAIKAAIAASLARRRSSMLGPPPQKVVDPEETCLSQGPPPDAALRRALALSAREVDDGGLQRALALSAAEARTEVVDLTLSQGSEGVSRTADDSQVEATQLEETQLVAPPPRRSVVDVSATPDETAVEETQLLPSAPRRSVVDVSATPDETAVEETQLVAPAPRRSVVDVSTTPDEIAVEETQLVDVTASPADERPPAVYVLTTDQLARTPLDALRPRKVVVYDTHAPSLLRHARRYAASRDVVLERLVVAGSLEETLATQTEAREALALQELQSLPKFASSVRPPSPDAPLIVVDARELRSEVPRALYDRGLRLAVATLTVADFVLSSSLAVERKNVDTNDLHSSLESGRLWTQLRALGAAYSTPTLLVEFKERSHRLDAPTTYLSLKHTQDRLAKAILEFPRTKLLWAPTPNATAALFAALADGEPDVEAAQRHRDDGDAAFRFLDKLPGLEPPRPDLGGNSLAQLASLDTDALTQILGSDRARRFAAFCTKPMEPVPLSEIEKNQPKRKRGRSPPRPRKR